MASIRKRRLPSGKFCWQFDYRDQYGKRRSKQFRTKKQAETWQFRIMPEVLLGVHAPDSISITVATACQNWLRRCDNEDLAASTLQQYRQHVRKHIDPFIGLHKLSRLSTPDVERFVDELTARASRSMSRKVLTSLKSVLTEAQRQGRVVQNVAMPVKVRVRRSEEETVQFPSKEQLHGLITAADGVGRAIVLLALLTGLRASEIRALAWSCVDFESRTLKVSKRADFLNQVGPPKSKAGVRSIPIGPKLYQILIEHRVSQAPGDLDLVFASSTGTVIGQSNLYHRIWRPVIEKAGLINEDGKPLFRFHDLRHAAASLFIEQGWSPKKIQELIGHSSITTTLDRYGHLWPSLDDDLRAMEQIENRLFL